MTLAAQIDVMLDEMAVGHSADYDLIATVLGLTHSDAIALVDAARERGMSEETAVRHVLGQGRP